MTKTKNRLLLGITFLIIPILFLTGVIIGFVSVSLFHSSDQSIHPSSTALVTPAPTPYEKTIYSLLLIGHGGKGHSGGGLADAIILLLVDTKTKKSYLLSIPRDTFINNQKINNIFATGGGSAMKVAVKTLTGFDVDYFVSVDFSGFSKSIDTLGGIEVLVPITFDDYFYPIKGKEDDQCAKSPEEIEAIHATMSGYLLEQQFVCRYEHLHFEKGKVNMTGETALKFVRSRHSSQHGGDFARSARQEAVLSAILKKVVANNALEDIPKFFSKFSGAIRSDLDAKVVEILYQKVGNPTDYSINNINLTTQNVFLESRSSEGAYILVPKSGENNFGPTHDFIRESL